MLDADVGDSCKAKPDVINSIYDFHKNTSIS